MNFSGPWTPSLFSRRPCTISLSPPLSRRSPPWQRRRRMRHNDDDFPPARDRRRKRTIFPRDDDDDDDDDDDCLFETMMISSTKPPKREDQTRGRPHVCTPKTTTATTTWCWCLLLLLRHGVLLLWRFLLFERENVFLKRLLVLFFFLNGPLCLGGFFVGDIFFFTTERVFSSSFFSFFLSLSFSLFLRSTKKNTTHHQ